MDKGTLEEHRFLAFIQTTTTQAVRYKVNKAASDKFTVFLDATPCSLVDGYLRFGRSGCFNFSE